MGSWSKRRAAPLLAAALLAPAGCGGGSGAPALPRAVAARTFQLARFTPAGPIRPGKPTAISFAIDQPNGKPLTRYAHGSGPHTGVHLLFVRSDLSAIVHRHPPVAADGTVSERVTFAKPGRYRVVVDAYPSLPGNLRNFQLFKTITVGKAVPDKPLPAFKASERIGGYRFRLEGSPDLKAVNAALLTLDVTDPQGRPARFTPWYGALAHAIFFRQTSLDYFHTHVCAPAATGCTSTLGSAQVTGTSSTPGKLRVGVLLPVAGTWRLFVQTRAGGKVLTAPFTLTVG